MPAQYGYPYTGNYPVYGEYNQTFGGAYVPVQLGTDAWTSVHAGPHKNSILAIKTNGTLWGWGRNPYGELGFGHKAEVYTAQQVAPGSTWSAISSDGVYHVLGIRSNGTLWSWGSNQYGQLGTGNNTERLTPTQVGTSTWRSVATGGNRSYAINTDRTLWAWGSNQDFGLGTLTVGNRLVPTRVNSTATWLMVAATYSSAAAIRTDGKLFTWGSGNLGTLGLGTTVTGVVSAPRQVGTDNWVYVAAGANSFYAIRADGALFAWGLNTSGELGNNSTANSFVPVYIGNLITPSSWKAVHGGAQYALAIAVDNTLWAWGSNLQFKLGLGAGATGTNYLTPTKVGTRNTWQKIAAGSTYSFGILSRTV